MKNYKAYYTVERITQNTIIRPDGFSSYYLENIGTDDAKINGIIPLNNTGIGRTFEEKPYVIISDDISIEFADINPNKEVFIVKTRYKEEGI